MKKKNIVLVLIFIIILMSLSGCGNQDIDKDSDKTNAEGTEIVAMDTESIVRFGRDWPTYADPGVGSSYTCQIAHINLYSPLVWPNTDGTVSPHVAKDWEISDDGLIYTFHLRDDVKFHSGNILTAYDVEFSLNRLFAIGEGFSHLYIDVIDSCKAIDDTTIEMHLKTTFGPFVNSLTRFFILEEELVMENIDTSGSMYGDKGDYGKNWLLTNDAGSGPYKVREFELEEYLLGEKFDDYFLGWDDKAPKFFKLTNMSDPVAQRTAFANDELEISGDSLPQETYIELEKLGGKIASRKSSGVWNASLNTKVAPTDCPEFRKALHYAFDQEVVTKDILIGASYATGPVNSLLFGKNNDLPGYKYNLDKAKEHLMNSKYADDPNQWVVDLAWCAEVPAQEKISLMWQADLAKLGIELNIIKTPFSVMTSDAQRVETTPNASMVQWSPNFLEAGDVFKSRYHSDATGGWEQMEWLLDEKLDKMIEKSLTIIDDDERVKAYQEIEKYIYDLCPTVWMCANDAKMAVQPYIEWDLLTYTEENIDGLFVGGYEHFYHDIKINK